MTTSETAHTLRSIRLREFSFLVSVPNMPSVSMMMRPWSWSNAAQHPAVPAAQALWPCLKIGFPPKKVWLRVWLFPSPVLPTMQTTLTFVSALRLR